jgi:[acyl-carrier-protein] S-malonyltransferase
LPAASVQSFVGRCTEGIVVAANFNSPQQVVVSGDEHGLEQVRLQATAEGGRCIRLNVQGAWHSPLVKTAAEAFRAEVASVRFCAPKYPLCIGMTASLERDTDRIQDLIQNQICSPVYWTDVIKKLEEMPITRYWEVGPGKVLKGLMRKIIDDVDSYEVVSVDNRKFLNELQSKKADGS